VIEASRGSANKLKFHPQRRSFELHAVLPLGQSFPYDFGFLPSTRGEDGDPLDVLVLMDEPVPAGVVVPCRILGVIRATQAHEGEDDEKRNDRFIAVAAESQRYRECRSFTDLAASVLDQIEGFFVAYNARKGVRFRPIGRHGADEALALVEQGRRAFRKG
ncbi:MAG TPA: inorganic diphosphatase, partial [Burkholderiaceae bacterium]